MTLDLSNAPLTAIHKDVPKHEPAKPVGLSMARLNVVRYCEWAIMNNTHFQYTQTIRRSEMFHLKPCTLRPAGKIYADCSQFSASVLHWAGVPGLTDTDYTGTLLTKGKPVDLAHVKPGDVAIFGPGHGVHAAVFTDHEPTGWFTASFGHSPGAPNRVSLTAFLDYFAKAGHPGLRVLSFTP